MTDDAAKRNFSSLESSKLDIPKENDIFCFKCDRKIKIGERYYLIDGYEYCSDCMDDEFGQWND